MTDTSTSFPAAIDELIASFNRRVLDVPSGFFDRNAQFTLNGVRFEVLLGRSDEDPLIRMIARGAAGYRFAAGPLLRAFETALVSRVSSELSDGRWDVTLTLRGTLRGSHGLLEEPVRLRIQTTASGSVRLAEVTIDQRALDVINRARRS